LCGLILPSPVGIVASAPEHRGELALSTSSTSRARAYNKIREAIYIGKFPPGFHLKEEELADFCGSSRTPVRLAIKDLANEGLVAIGANRRSRVADIGEIAAEEAFDILAMLECYGAKLAAINITEEDLEKLKALNTEMSQHVSSNPEDDDLYINLNSAFHRIIYRASCNDLIIEMMPRAAGVPASIYLKFGQRTENVGAIDEHAQIIAALEARDPELAALTMKVHIEALRREYRNILASLDSGDS